MKNLVFAIVVLTVSGLLNISKGQSLSDWEKARSNAKTNLGYDKWAGLNSIPYDDIRRAAESPQAELKNLTLVQHACDDKEHGTKVIRKSLKDLEEEHLIQATTESGKAKVTEQIKEKKAMLQDRIEKAKIRAEYCQKVLAARMEVRKQVGYAIEKGKLERDPEIKPVADELVAYWESDRTFHEQAISEAEKAVKNCKECADGEQ